MQKQVKNFKEPIDFMEAVMLLEVQVMGSAEWYEKVLPSFEKMGFASKENFNWSDPETDGELMGFYYDLSKKEGLPVKEFFDYIAEIEKIIMDGEAPYVKFTLVPDKNR